MQSAKWEKIFENHIFDKGLIIQNIKRTHTLNSKKKKKNPIKQQSKDLNKKKTYQWPTGTPNGAQGH